MALLGGRAARLLLPINRRDDDDNTDDDGETNPIMGVKNTGAATTKFSFLILVLAVAAALGLLAASTVMALV